MPREDTEVLLRSVDHFVDEASRCPVTAPEREHLLDRLGLFGVRLSLALLRQGEVSSASELATELVDRSGLQELRRTLASQFASRRDVLKCRSVLLALEELVARAGPAPAWLGVARELERITAGAHEFAELRLLHALRTGAITVKDDEAEAMERLLGAAGPGAAARLGLPADAAPSDVEKTLGEELARWRRRAESPLSTRAVAEAARVLVRTCEGLLSVPSRP